MFPTKKDSDSIPVPLASFTGRDPFAHKCTMHLIGSGSERGGDILPPLKQPAPLGRHTRRNTKHAGDSFSSCPKSLFACDK